jgi:hypothetical protein
MLQTADGALRIVESHMADLMRQMTIERGRDARDHDRYEQVYGAGSAFAGAGTQIGLLKVQARGHVNAPDTPAVAVHSDGPAGSRDVYWREYGEFRATEQARGARARASAVGGQPRGTRRTALRRPRRQLPPGDLPRYGTAPADRDRRRRRAAAVGSTTRADLIAPVVGEAPR